VLRRPVEFTKVTSFKVMVRPLKAIQVVVPKMGELLAQGEQQ
jgi:hypothetical protein